ncbi:MAG: CapA family protein [Clostridia bacterium]|nr:CapA family protein [Clostridia bacterium]
MKKRDILITIFALLIAIVVLSGVIILKANQQLPTILDSDGSEAAESQAAKIVPGIDYEKLSAALTALEGREVTISFLQNIDGSELEALNAAVDSKEYGAKTFHDITGYTVNAYNDKFVTRQSKDMGNNGKDSFVLGFTGDINFTESGYVMTHANAMPGSVNDCIDETFRNEMKKADIMLINNEFPYTDRGSPTPGKKYTFRAKPENVKYLVENGVDLVSLANNHAYDYGYESFVDTIKTLNDAGIPYVGAGMNLEEAAKPATFLINGYKVAYLACCGVESPIKTPVATENSEGIMGSYDDGERMTQAIRKAKAESDYVIVYPHWGIENTTSLTNAQQVNSKKWIDAGADAVVGGHPHILQGFEFYKGAPVVYSLGNFWFNTRNIYTMLFKLTISADGIVSSIVPGRQEYSEVHYIADAAAQRKMYDELEGYPPYNKVRIYDNGVVTDINAPLPTPTEAEPAPEAATPADGDLNYAATATESDMYPVTATPADTAG